LMYPEDSSFCLPPCLPDPFSFYHCLPNRPRGGYAEANWNLLICDSLALQGKSWRHHCAFEPLTFTQT
jgi:hypothetical protein